MENNNQNYCIKDTNLDVMDMDFKDLHYVFRHEYMGDDFPDGVSVELMETFNRFHLLLLIQNSIERNDLFYVKKYYSIYLSRDYDSGKKLNKLFLILNSNNIEYDGRNIIDYETNIYDNILLCKYNLLLKHGNKKDHVLNIISKLYDISPNTVNSKVKNARKYLLFKYTSGSKACYFMMLRYCFINNIFIEGVSYLKNAVLYEFIKNSISNITILPNNIYSQCY